MYYLKNRPSQKGDTLTWQILNPNLKRKLLAKFVEYKLVNILNKRSQPKIECYYSKNELPYLPSY